MRRVRNRWRQRRSVRPTPTPFLKVLVMTAGTFLWSCGSESPAAEPTGRLQLDAFLDDPSYRRQLLEQSLRVTDNDYAALRLTHYAKDWEALAVLAPRVAKVKSGQQPPETLEPLPLPSGRSEQHWTALGEIAFSLWPSQALPQLELALRTLGEQAPQALGLWQDTDGWIGGLVWVDYGTGGVTIAATCATCHARITDGSWLPGAPADVAWGPGPPGTVDVTADAVDNPVALPDLRLLALQRSMHWEANLRSDLGSLAVRIETLLIDNAGARVRPPREIPLGLALYLETLVEDASPESAPLAERLAPEGALLFAEHCEACHFDTAGAGDWVRAAVVGTDARAAESPQRGTGGYRTPTLWRVAERTRFLHTAYQGTLRGFLDVTSPERAGHGHLFSQGLQEEALNALVDYLTVRFSPPP